MRMPAEFEKQAATWLAFPHNEEDWPEKFGPVPWAYAEFIRLIAATQKVHLLANSKDLRRDALDICKRAGVAMKNLECHVIPTDRGWMRDCGPIFVYDGKKKLMLDWGFTGWAKYDNHLQDDRVPHEINRLNKVTRVLPKHKTRRVVLEGGSIDVNGKGSILTTEECLLADVQVRNKGFTREDYEAVFEEYLGAGNVIWLGKGIVGDDTHGHVDDISRFVSADTVVTVVEKDKRDDNHALLKDNVKRL
ncbi:MAG: agmatine deiminase family protein, partial [Proteobacteria bacterium]|nr:agmatine deiminase family protein [Pseudomonadota bacterium]